MQDIPEKTSGILSLKTGKMSLIIMEDAIAG